MDERPNRLFDDFAKLMTDAAGVAQGVRREAETAMRHQAERILADMDFARRDEMEVLREIALKARAENEALAERVAALEAKLAFLSGGHVVAEPPAPEQI